MMAFAPSSCLRAAVTKEGFSPPPVLAKYHHKILFTIMELS